MKQVIWLSALSVLLACNSSKEKGSTTTSDTASASTGSATTTYSLPVQYSASWEMGDPKLAEKYLTMENDWLNGSLASYDDAFADSMSVYLANGDKIMGDHDSMLNTARNIRKMYSEIKNDIHAIISLRHRDTKEDWVLVWYKEVTTTTQGIKDSIEIQDNWRFNSQGKVDLVYQLNAVIKP